MSEADTQVLAGASGKWTIRRLIGWGWRVASRPAARFSLGMLLLVGFVTGVFFWGAFNWGMEMTSTEMFCRGCHEMDQNVYREYRMSVHDQNPSGVRASCPDCHVPHDWPHKMKRKIQASSEVFHHLTGEIDTREKFEAKRLDLARNVWAAMKATDSRECRNCHNFDSMDLSRQNDRAREDHSRAEKEGLTCIDCHKGIAHHLPAGAFEAERELNETWNSIERKEGAGPK
ncbi:NapC/NirT family cytochrome c [Telmatospirillum siberiense]|uniref:Cytochrome c-type protein n=1 Tax=Telmatospirillum siberiense TaxID=382514 RepID=A0A2N3PWX6_9PROT|nr:NapC/NirT family cytochrome c [Telmatospirillum siberiense]PKU24888.1 Denitrification system component NirT [Telmatospirillum siberiense]